MRIEALRRRSGGFTLIELLVVIAIIAILAAFLSVGLSRTRDRARVAGTQGLIHKLEVACGDYRAKFLVYPPSPNSSSAEDNAKSLYQFLCMPIQVRTSFEAGGTSRVRIEAPVLTDLSGEELKDPDVGANATTAITDRWGNPIDYIRENAGYNCTCRASGPKSAGGHDHRTNDCRKNRAGGSDGAYTDNRQTADIESMGPIESGKDSFEWGDNDVANWKSR